MLPLISFDCRFRLFGRCRHTSRHKDHFRFGGYAASVITAVTAQNTLGVQSVYQIPVDMVKAQVTSVMDDLRPMPSVQGMVYDAGIVTTIVRLSSDIYSGVYSL